jgi:hypothetical protein
MPNKDKRVAEALQVLANLALPRAQQNERTALCLLALLDLTPDKTWKQAKNPLMGITPIMDWSREHYQKQYAPNTRETFRRQSMHQFVSAGIALYNPDKPDRPVNSPAAAYQIEPGLLAVLRTFKSKGYTANMTNWLRERKSLVERYARNREMQQIPIQIARGKKIRLSAGKHSELIKAVIEQFAPRFLPGGKLVYIGDTGTKWGYFDEKLLARLGITVDNHGKMPDVVIHFTKKDWLVLIEAVTSHGPVDSKRHEELERLFTSSKAGLVYVSAFPTRRVMNKYLEAISWESEVWVADTPTHLIHFNGSRFLGPY